MSGHVAAEALGWVATATFVASYLFRRAETLVRVQMAGAVLWIVYGALLGASPVVAANALVFAAAAWKSRRAGQPARADVEGALADALSGGLAPASGPSRQPVGRGAGPDRPR